LQALLTAICLQSVCRVSAFRIRQMSLNDRDTHCGTGVSFSPIPDRRFHLALIVGPRRLSQSGDRDEVPAISDPSVLLQSELRRTMLMTDSRTESVRLNCSLLMRQEVFCRNNGSLEKLIARRAFHGVPTSALPSFVC